MKEIVILRGPSGVFSN